MPSYVEGSVLTPLMQEFGNVDTTPPADAEISIGIAAYALAANSILLFHDIPTDKLYLLQAKGCFKAPLGEYEQPLLGRYLRWSDLPQVTYTKLASVEILTRKHLPKTEPRWKTALSFD
jgi:hypothetical protein